MAVNFTTELIQVADAVAREKDVPREAVIQAMENAIEIAARKKYGYEHTIRAKIDGTGVKLFRDMEVVADNDPEALDEEKRFTKISLSEARQKNADIEIGGVISEPLPPIDLGRVAAQTAKQVIIQKVRDAERERQFDEYKNRVGEIMNGIVKRVDFGNVIVGLGHSTEAVITRDNQIRGENFKVNDRVRAYLKDVRRETKGHQIFLSRTAPEFMAKLFAQEVPEIYDGIIEVKSVAREPGSRAKIAVFSHDPGIDPVGSCVGVRGARVQAVIAELQGEKIDIIQYSADPATFIVNALAPAEVAKVVIDEDKRRIEVVVPDEQLSLAIGRRGQNVRLASQLAGWNIDVLTEETESKRRTEEFNNLSELFIKALDVEDVIAHLLVAEGFTSVEEVAYVPVEDLSGIEGFDADVAEELRQRARTYLESLQQKLKDAAQTLGIEAAVFELPHLKDEHIVALGEKGLKTLDDIADLSHDEFVELIPASGLKRDQIDETIMAARAHWFDQDSAAKA
ncbi:MAG: transcription elongation factor NusA [Rickettsiales bacterium]|nr:transcription elongation factor NusA [Rickettsiales bacterium]